MIVIKKNGKEESFNPNKILNRIKKASINLNVDYDLITKNVIAGIYDGITTKELDELTSEIAIGFYTKHPDYSKLASNILISRFLKEFDNKYKSFLNVTENLKSLNIINDDYYNYVKTNIKFIEDYITNHKLYNYNYDYFAWGRLTTVYLTKNKKTGEIYESPIHMIMRTALQCYPKDISKALVYFVALVNKLSSPATPTWLNSGKVNNQLASCELHWLTDDSTEGILDVINNTARSASLACGIGLGASNLRSSLSLLSNGGKAAGILKLLKILNETMRFWDQGGVRPGSCAVYLETWHKDILQFLESKLPTGKDELRARDMFLALWVSDSFMEAVINKKEWYLFCPDELKRNGIKPLYDLYGEEFEEERLKAISLNLGIEVKAMDIWLKICEVLSKAGMPYILFKDTINKKSNHKNIGTIKSSNLCAEIVQYTDSNTIATCMLHSIPVQKFIKLINNEYVIDYLLLEEVVKYQVEALNNIIDNNKYSSPKAQKGAFEQRAIAIGIQGLADALAIMKYPFTSEKAKLFNYEIMEAIYFFALKASNELASNLSNNKLISDMTEEEIEKYSYKYFKGSPMSEGLLQYDLSNETDKVESNSKFNWKSLKENIIKYGIRNSMLTGLMPTASSAAIIGSNESFEPYTANVYIRSVKEKYYTMVNKHMINDFIKLGIWNENLEKKILANEGSVQNLSEVPYEFQQLYKIAAEISQKDLIDMAYDRSLFIDQTQSFNLFFNSPDINKISQALVYSWKKGMKTGSYYIHTDSASKGGKWLSNDINKENINISQENNQSNSKFECFGCGS